MSSKVQVTLTDEAYNALLNEAKPYGKTVSAWIQLLIIQHLEEMKKYNNK